ncbi:MAG: mechanosensitive ion channel domain-containing protein, partial [Myxococcota bacterium]
VGWSARDVLPDLVAWTFLAAEGRIRAGTWVQGDGFEGIVDALRPRATWIVDPRGHHLSVPNRRLLRAPVRADRSRHPEVELSIRVSGVSPMVARAALREAILLSPWLAPQPQPEIGWDPIDPDRWTARVRIVDLRFRDRFVGAVQERLQEVLDDRRNR